MKWDENILETLTENIEKYRENVINVLSLVLPELARGFFVQEVMYFGLDPMCPKRVNQYDVKVLNEAPINNLDSERAVGSINHELGATQLDAASSNFVKSKSYDLIELQPLDAYKNYTEDAKKVNHLVREWKEKQVEMEKQGMSKKMIERISSERRRVKDLDKLKKDGGHFAKPEEVKGFTASDLSEKEKQDRLYIEFRFARDTTLS